jgi:cytoskeletal protein CcmA (bactofilin family)
MSFRRFGGIPKRNIVASNLMVTENVGQPNSYINFLSDISGDIIIYGNLDVSGNLTVEGNIDINGNTTIDGNIDISGNASIGGNFDVSGNSHFDGDVDISGNTTMDGNLDINGNVDISGNITGNITINTNLAINGNVDISGNINMVGNLDISGNTNIVGDIDISGNINMSGDIDVSGNITAYYMFLSSDNNYATQQNAVMPKSYIDTVSTGPRPAGEVSAISTTGNSGQTQNTIYPVPINTDLSANFMIDGIDISGGNAVLLNDQDPSGGASVNNGVYYFINTSGSTYQFQRDASQNVLPVGSDARNAFVAVLKGNLYSRSGWIQTSTDTSTNIVGTDPLFFSEFFSLNFKVGQGLYITEVGSISYLNVDPSLNFINFLDSTPGITNATGTLAIGTDTSNVIIGPTGGNSVQFQSEINAQKGITGPTASFTDLITSNLITAPGGITGTTGSFTYLSSTSGITGPTGSFTDLITSNFIKAPGGITGTTGSFTYLSSTNSISGGTGSFTDLITSNLITAQGKGITGTTGSFTYLSSSSGITGPTGSFTDIITSNLITAQGKGITGTTGSFTYLSSTSGITGPTGSFTNIITSNLITAQGKGITGTTGSFTYLSSTSGITGPTGSFTDIITSNLITAQGKGITGTTGSFTYLSSTSGITGPTGSFTFLNSSNNSYLATSSGNVGIGKTNPSSKLDVSGNASISGTLNVNDAVTGPTGSFTFLNSSNNTYLATGSSKVGIGKTSANYNLDVSGNLRLVLRNSSEFSVEDDTSKFNYNGFNPNAGTKIFYNYPVVNDARTTFLNNGQGQSGTNGFGFYMCSAAVPTPVLATVSCGKLGVGIYNPQYSLDVSGVGRFGTYSGSYTTPFAPQLIVSGDTTGDFANDNGQVIITGTSNPQKRLGIQFDTTNNNVKFQAALAGTPTNYPICLNPVGGNVAIGKNTTSATLDVAGTALITSTGLNSSPTLSLRDDSTSNEMRFALNCIAGNYNSLVQAGDQVICATPQNTVEVLTLCSNSSTTNGVRITPTSVVIGAGGSSATPTAALSFSGKTATVTGVFSQGQDASFNVLNRTQILYNSNDPAIPLNLSFSIRDSNSTRDLQFYSNVGTQTTAPIIQSGDSAIVANSSSPSLSLTAGFTSVYTGVRITTTSAIIGFGGSASTPSNYFMANSSGVSIVSSGNISLRPTTTLDVSGNTRISGRLDVSGNMTIDGSANFKFLPTYTGSTDASGNPSPAPTNNQFITKKYADNTYSGAGSNLLITDNSWNGINTFKNTLTSTTNTYLATTSGNVGIGTTSPGSKLDVNGNARATSFITTSDYRIKENIHLLNESYNVDNLRPITYLNKNLNKQDIGLIAHELQQVFPCLVTGDKDGQDMQSVNYIGLIPILIKEIQDLKKELKLLKEKVL